MQACRIPVADISEARGYFVSWPDGSVQGDPASVVALPGNTPGQAGQNPGLTYVASKNRWLPVPEQWIAPDGHAYAFQNRDGIAAVTLPAGNTTQLVTGNDWILLGIDNTAIYLESISGHGGLYRLGLDGAGVPRQLAAGGFWDRVHEGEAWTVDGQGMLVRLQLPGGPQTNVASVGVSSHVAGFDTSGQVFITLGGALSLIRTDGTGTTVWSGRDGLAANKAVGDANGVWFEVGGGLIGAPGHGVYLWTPAKGAALFSRQEGIVAGLCT